MKGCCLLHFKWSWPIAFTVHAPKLEEHLLQILDPGRGVKEGAGQPGLLQALAQMQALGVVQAQLNSAVLHALVRCRKQQTEGQVLQEQAHHMLQIGQIYSTILSTRAFS